MKKRIHITMPVLSLVLLTTVVCAQDADTPRNQEPEDPATNSLPAQLTAENAESDATTKQKEQYAADGVERRGEIVRILNDVVIPKGEEAEDTVVILGNARVEGNVRGDLVVVGGLAKVNGTVDGDVAVPLGSLELGPLAHLKGDVVVVGGGLTIDQGAKLDNPPIAISWEQLEEHVPPEVLRPVIGAKDWVVQGLILGRPLPHQLGWWSWLALSCALIYMLTAALFPRPVAASLAMLESQPVGSFFMGLLTFVLFGPLLLLLAATGIGLVMIPFVICGAVIALLFGKVAVYRLTGQQIGKQLGVTGLQMPLLALIFGIGVFYLVYMIPVVGFLVWGVVAPLGFGAAILAFFRAFRSEGQTGGNWQTNTPSIKVAQPPVIPGEAAFLNSETIVLLPRAGFWIRFAATFLDLLLIGAIAAVVQFPPFFLLAWVAYHVGMWTWKGSTVGGVVFGIKIVRRDGRPADFALALVRSLASFLSALVFFLGYFWAGWTREKLAWHDMIAGTIVVKVPRGISLV